MDIGLITGCVGVVLDHVGSEAAEEMLVGICIIVQPLTKTNSCWLWI